MKRLPFALALASLSACAVDSLEEDGRDDSFTSGKADTGGIAEGSPEAIAVLAVANQQPVHALRDHGVAKNAAENIVAGRAGSDDLLGTPDDVTFASLAQLDAVPFVGPVAFARLLAFAEELGQTPPSPTPLTPPSNPWSVSSCAPITFAQLLAKFPAGATRVWLDRPYATTSRRRERCNVLTGCTPWIAGGVTLVGSHESIHRETVVVPTGTGGDIELGISPPNPSVGFNLSN